MHDPSNALAWPNCLRRGRVAPFLQPLTRRDLWVNGQEVASLDLLESFASLRDSSRLAFSRAHNEAMSTDIVLTSNARTGPVVTHEPGSDLRFYL